MRILAIALLAACNSDGEPPGTTDSTDEPSGYDLVCSPPSPTSCGDEAASIRGAVRLDPTGDWAGPTSGDLFIGLAHEWLGGGVTGGFPHVATIIPGVDLSLGPVEFELDMCDGGIMWSEDNCSYQLVAILDQNGNQSGQNWTPDADELTGRVQDVELSCGGDSPCMDLQLGCVGPSCLTFTDPGQCQCADTTCDSDYKTCR
jgi:hypothetical protein